MCCAAVGATPIGIIVWLLLLCTVHKYINLFLTISPASSSCAGNNEIFCASKQISFQRGVFNGQIGLAFSVCRLV